MQHTPYQPTKNKQLTAAQEVLYAKAFKQADIAGGFRKPRVKQANKENPNQN
ncbi:YfhE family protein [Cerasibacillus sp. JNUCC 74]|uniref:YfhE family protein n=1 Tax=Virgibacillus proomii TaxID=84407 RepID=UPI00117C01F5|nr:YfhE family protein [Virgibacillus proomii]